MFAYFEKLVDPYPTAEPSMPPKGVLAFCLHYSRPLAGPLIAMSILTAIISLIEIFFFAFVGNLVDWLSNADRATFFDDHGWELAGMAAVILIGFPLATFIQSLFMFQTIAGSFPMLVRWKAHRYILG
ncbi:MAG: ABC transporter ATP-binding protein, partial [Bauldia sp.]|nr:ABC transporter ATP-binding protein [Bauldia sp.]